MNASAQPSIDADPGRRAPLRVLHLRDSPWLDGPGRTILETAAHVDPRRVEFRIGALVSKDGAHPLLTGAQARGLAAVAIRDPGGHPRGLVSKILEVVDAHGIEVLHASDFRTGVAALWCRKQRPSLKVVATAHGWIANTLRRRVIRLLDKFLLRQFDRVILVSDAMRALVPRWWLPDSRVTVLHNALVLDSYGREVLQAKRPPPDPVRALRLLNIGRLSPEKGQIMLLQAVARLANRWPAISLKFAGIGPLEGDLRREAERLGIASRIEFLGFVNDMPTLYQHCDLVVQSSFTEGLPNVILEGAYLRVPMVATAVGGTGEVIQHGHSGWLIRPTVDDLVAGVEAFASQPGEFVAMAERAHQNILEKFSFAARTQRLMRFYDELLGRA